MSCTIRLAVLTALPVAALSICALAQNVAPASRSPSQPSFFQHMLEKMDTNGDGRISLDEYLATATTRFKGIDAQNKGSIDAADIASSPETVKRDQHMAQFMIKRLDTAGQGYVTQDEFLAAAKKRFARLDKKGDGRLTPDELTGPRWSQHAHGTPAATASATAATASDTPANNRAQFAQKRAQFAQKHFDALDTNHDGVVTEDEYLAAATAKFKKLDTEGSGKVTAQELAASPQTLKRDARRAQFEVKRMGADSNGEVSLDQYLATAKTRFGKLDKNGDGYIDADELPAHHWAHGASKPVPSAN
jgi:Ca2+-binding EF-hand superfamily protein